MSPFAERVRGAFARHAAEYDGMALLQRSVAWRLAALCRGLPPPPAGAPRADLGAGTGLLSLALGRYCPQLGAAPPLQLDLCPELLARNPLVRTPAHRRLWDLNRGLPGDLEGAGLLVSSFALQWLEAPVRELQRWGRLLCPGGWLAVAVPTSGSFPQWRQAAAAAGVPCTALALPQTDALIRAVHAAGVVPSTWRCVRYSRPCGGGLASLRRLRDLGAGASRSAPLTAPELRRLLRHWPASTPLTWEVLLLVGRRI